MEYSFIPENYGKYQKAGSLVPAIHLHEDKPELAKSISLLNKEPHPAHEDEDNDNMDIQNNSRLIVYIQQKNVSCFCWNKPETLHIQE